MPSKQEWKARAVDAERRLENLRLYAFVRNSVGLQLDPRVIEHATDLGNHTPLCLNHRGDIE